MRDTKHAAPRARRGRGPVRGVPLAVAAVGVLVCLGLSLLLGNGSGTGTAQPAAASVAATEPGSPPVSGTSVAVTPSAPPSSATSPSPSASPSAGGSPSPSAPPTARPTASTTVPSPSAATSGARTVASTAPLAGRIKPGTSYSGVATSYDAADGNGACLFGPSDDLMVAAMNHTDYDSSNACGAYVLVRAANGASVTVRIVNDCPLPCAPGQLDLSHQAFAELAELSVGRLPITWTLLSPAVAPATMSIRYKTGSSQWWCGIQVIGHRNPVAALEVRTGGGWRRLSRTDYDYFLSPDGSGCGGTIRVTDIYGEQLTVDGLAVKPDVAQPTSVQFARR
ncbi:expansin EXLX1 family cellulose-binding protein [Kitasatospora sp. NPDC017646]|uniref:expansin EXLX1 family cellulose-binding protein n=1 Tax=Kitasatospora sp. NPDC017646 TaxID=3364024 RepID=UPI0037B22849